jgi:hypothetical protein
MDQKERQIIQGCVALLQSTLGGMSAKDADAIVRSVAQILQSL